MVLQVDLLPQADLLLQVGLPLHLVPLPQGDLLQVDLQAGLQAGLHHLLQEHLPLQEVHHHPLAVEKEELFLVLFRTSQRIT